MLNEEELKKKHDNKKNAAAAVSEEEEICFVNGAAFANFDKVPSQDVCQVTKLL